MPVAGGRPFKALSDPAAAGLGDVEQLYYQASAIGGIAYLLFAAADPLAATPGEPEARAVA